MIPEANDNILGTIKPEFGIGTNASDKISPYIPNITAEDVTKQIDKLQTTRELLRQLRELREKGSDVDFRDAVREYVDKVRDLINNLPRVDYQKGINALINRLKDVKEKVSDIPGEISNNADAVTNKVIELINSSKDVMHNISRDIVSSIKDQPQIGQQVSNVINTMRDEITNLTLPGVAIEASVAMALLYILYRIFRIKQRSTEVSTEVSFREDGRPSLLLSLIKSLPRIILQVTEVPIKTLFTTINKTRFMLLAYVTWLSYYVKVLALAGDYIKQEEEK